MALEITSPTKSSKYFTKHDLLTYNTINKCYISLFADVYDITDTISSNKLKPQSETLYKFAGKDVSHFFNPETRKPYEPSPDLKNVADAVARDRVGELHSAKCADLLWFDDRSLVIGKMTGREVKVRFVNTLNYIEHTLVVPVEETLNEICYRYLAMNKHAKSYTWKDINGCVLNMELTLKENGICEKYDELEYINVPDEEIYVPTIYLYFNDDLTIL